MTAPVRARATRFLLFTVVAYCVFLINAPLRASQDGYAKLSPFQAIRFMEHAPLVQVGDQWYELIKINELGGHEILMFCEQTYGDLAQKRFAEDLVQVLSEMGHPPARTVDLTVRKLTGRTPTVLNDVAMTHENRQRIAAANRRVAVDPNQRDTVITREQAQEDLDTLERALRDQYSYLTRTGFDYASTLRELRATFADNVNVAEFAIDIQKVLTGFGDGHTRVSGISNHLPGGYLPFAVSYADGRIVAHDPLEGKLIVDDAPYITAIDGVELDRWVDAAGVIVADGSPSFQTFVATERLMYLNWLRDELGLPISEQVTVQLGGRMHMGLESITLAVAERPVRSQVRQRVQYEFIANNIMLLRIPSFSSRLAPQHVEKSMEAMEKARVANGLIIDVRGNSGGGRRALQYLMPYVLAEGEKPVVVNTAKYRLNSQFESDHLANRFLHRHDAPHWTDAERDAIDAFATSFSPKWIPPAEQFSDWHYMVVRPKARNDVYHFDKPVVILMDRDCFSATDIFLGAFKGRADVTLIGTPSGGGSGRTVRVQLPNSKIRIPMSSMVSYQRNGELYDDNGIQPDIVIEQSVRDIIGETDTQLNAALRVIEEQASKR